MRPEEKPRRNFEQGSDPILHFHRITLAVVLNRPKRVLKAEAGKPVRKLL